MNKMFLSFFILWCAMLLFVGCEVQSVAEQKTSVNSELEEQVILLANTVDPYERYTRNEIYLMLEKFMHENPDIYATGFATVESTHAASDFNYIYKDGTTYITIDGYDYDSVDAEVKAVIEERILRGENFWSPLYVREDGSGNKVTVNTFFCPIANDSGNVVYILTADVVKEIN